MKNRIIALVVMLALGLGVAVAGRAYYDFVAQTIFEESTNHLVEIFHQANQALYNLVSVNWSRMRMWTPYLETINDEEKIAAYVDQARQESNFTDFYFISRDGEYLSVEGQRGYLDLRDQLADLILNDQPVVANSVVPYQPEIMVFATPAKPGFFQDFAYEAIAITYNNSDMVEALKTSAFGGQASTFAVLPDGRIVVDNASADLQTIHNIYAWLRDSDNLSKEDLTLIQQDFRTGASGKLLVQQGDISYYLTYESAMFQDWMVLGLVPAEVVNASMSRLQSVTMTVVAVISLALALTVLLLVSQQNRQKLKQKDHQLLARDELFSKLSGTVDDVFLMVDAKSMEVEYVSPNIEKLVGLTEKEVFSNLYTLEHLIGENESVHVLDHLSQTKAGEQREWDREYTHQKTGEKRWFRVMLFCSDIQGEKKYILDLSDRTKDKMINQQLEEAVHAAENANRAKTIFLNNMSHDIRTPMNAIVGFTNIAMKHHPKPEVMNCLEKIGESSEHLLTLINDVLDISRIESGKIKFLPTPVDITAVTDTVLSITYGFLSNRNIQFNAIQQTPPTPYVLADAVRIREVLVNIIGNAVKFTNDGGSITFETSYHSGADARHMMVRYRVTDTGVGMSEQFVEHIFDEFSQEQSGATKARTHYKGTGLGMAISKRYVDLMEGTITVQSKKGEGSTFLVELPLEVTEESKVLKQGLPVSNVNLQGVKILMAEDNDLNAEIAMVQLEEQGIHVTRAANGREVVRIFADHPPDTFDLIFMDVMMPEMNGYQATEAIRTLEGRPDARTIPIIAMTANAFAEDVQASLDAGMNGHLAKPIVMDEVTKTIARSLNH